MCRECIECGEPIPAARLAVQPEAEMCVTCLAESGDAPRYLGIRTPIKGATKHLDGCDSHIVRNPDFLRKTRTLYKHQRYPQ